MHKLSKELDRKSLERIYKVVSDQNWNMPALYGMTLEHDKNALENCQLHTASSVTGAKRGTSHEKMYGKTGWLKL